MRSHTYLKSVTAVLVLGIFLGHLDAQPPPNCDKIQKRIDQLRDQRQQAESNLSEDNCAGSGRTICLSRLHNIDGQIATEERALQLCRQGFPNPFNATIYPHYILLSIIYAPPGNQSSVTYGKGSTFGSRSEYKGSFKPGVNFSFTAVLTNSIEYSSGSDLGGFVEIRKEASHTVTAQSRLDDIAHDEDLFLLWTNPEMVLTPTPQRVLITLRPKNGELMQVTTYIDQRRTAASEMIPATKKSALSAVTGDDYRNILLLNPFVSNRPLDQKRFEKLDTLQIDGPDNPTDPVSGQGLSESYETATGTIKGDDQEVKIGLSGEIDLAKQIGMALAGGISLDSDYEEVTESSSGSKQEMETSLPSVVTPKPANGGQGKTGQRKRPGTKLFYPAASSGGKSVFVRQLRGPHLST